jgi:hypothetical protein
MNKYDEFRKFAQEAQELANRAKNPADKAAWLKIAESWLRLLPKPRATAEEKSNAQKAARGTGQKDSEKAH